MVGRKRRKVSTNLVLICLQFASDTHSEKAYPLGCSHKPTSYYDYEQLSFPPTSLPIQTVDDYLLTRRLGTGKFSDVFEAVDVASEKALPGNKHPYAVDPRTLVVVKCLKPVTERKIRREILVLERASEIPNLARLISIVVSPEYYSQNRQQQTDLPRMPALVLQHAGPSSQWLCHGGANQNTNASPPDEENKNSTVSAICSSSLTPSPTFLTDYEIRYYLYHLLAALDGLHAAGIMHRDVKPRNVLVNRKGRALHAPLMLIDLGLADFYHPNVPYNVRVASRHYKAPELLLGYRYYDYAIDMWGVGCILVGLLFHREPYFRGRDNVDQLGKIVSVLGTDDLWAFIQKYEVQLSNDVQRELSRYSTGQYRQRQSWLTMATTTVRGVANRYPAPSQDALALLDHLLVYDHEDRWTAQQAMQHTYFDIVRERVQAEAGTFSKN